MTTLSGKTTLVTGASRGMGRASALALAAAGTQVLVHYGCGAKEADSSIDDVRAGEFRDERRQRITSECKGIRLTRAQHRHRIVDRGNRDRDGFISERPAARIVVVLAMPTTRTPGRSTSASVRIPEAAVTM